MKSEQVLRVSGLNAAYGKHMVFQDVSFSVDRGTVLTVVGPSASGKTTLLKCLNLLHFPISGEIVFRQNPIYSARQGAPPSFLESIGRRLLGFDQNGSQRRLFCPLPAYRRNFGMVFQEFNLWPDLTIEENIAGPLKWMHGSDPSKIRDRVVQCAKLVQIESILQKYPNEVSGGQKQRAAIARALAPRPEVLLFDEITSALDPDLAFEILQIIEALTKTGITMVVVTHHMNFARRVSHGIAFMAGRRLRPVQKPEDFFRSITPEIRDFLRHVQDL